MGLEPIRLAAHAPQTCAYTYSATSACAASSIPTGGAQNGRRRGKRSRTASLLRQALIESAATWLLFGGRAGHEAAILGNAGLYRGSRSRHCSLRGQHVLRRSGEQ